MTDVADRMAVRDEDIQGLVARICAMVSRCDPLELLVRCNKVAALDFYDFKDEQQREISRSAGLLRAGEYVQSILISADCAHMTSEGAKDGMPLQPLETVLDDVKCLYEKLYSYLLFQSIKKSESTGSRLQDDALFSVRILYHTARGKRAYAYQRRFFDMVLAPHDGLLRAVYGIGADAIIVGILKLLRNLAFSSINYYLWKSSSESLRDIRHSPPVEEVRDDFDVKKVTGWSDKLIDALTFDVAGTRGFGHGSHAGWPLRDLPVKDRPFIRIGGNVYAFNYYIVADYIYRAIQFATERLAVEYGVPCQWDVGQCVASESEARRIFQKLFPGAQMHVNNYHPLVDDPERWAENDLIVRYADVVFIVEVKGGKMKHLSPDESPAVVRNNLAGFVKAIEQCNRMEEYLLHQKPAIIYDGIRGKKKEGFHSDRQDSIFKVAVSVDGMNEVTSRAVSMQGLVGDAHGVICLSFDDLHVYEDYFNGSPSRFLWYLQERRRLAQRKEIYSADEMDHLAGFINCPWIVARAEKCLSEGFSHLSMGSADELNDYLSSSLNLSRRVGKPQPPFPPLVNEILDALDRTHDPHTMALVNVIRHLDGEYRTALEQKASEMLTRCRMGQRPGVEFGAMPSGEGVVVAVGENGRCPELDRVWIDVVMRRWGIRRWRAFAFAYNGRLDRLSYLQGGEWGEFQYG